MKLAKSSIVAWVIVVLLATALVALFQNPGERTKAIDISYSELVSLGPKLKSAIIRGDELEGRDDQGRHFVARLPRDKAFADSLVKNGTDVVIGEPRDSTSWVTTLVTNGAPLVIYLIAWMYPLLRIARALETLAVREKVPPG